MRETVAERKAPEIEVAVLSEAGLREENQDWMSWSRVSWGECYTLADGMGGYKGGATASRMTIEGVERYLKEQSSELSFPQALQVAVRKTNSEIYQAAQSGNPDTSHMGSTLAVALISGKQLTVGNIGDSRIYLFRKGKLRQLTTDHTSVQLMVTAGMITPNQARSHPEAHILNRAVGSKPEAEVEVAPAVELEDGDGILLCSDGLSGYAEDEQIAKTLDREPDVQSVPAQLVKLALKAGSDDNITVQFIRYGKPTGKLRLFGFGRVPRALPLAMVAVAAVAIALAIPSVRQLLHISEENSPQVTASVTADHKPADQAAPAAVASQTGAPAIPLGKQTPNPAASAGLAGTANVKPENRTTSRNGLPAVGKDKNPVAAKPSVPSTDGKTVLVLVYVTSQSDKAIAKKIEDAVGHIKGNFTLEEVSQDPGPSNIEPAILYPTPEMADAANYLQTSLQSETSKSWSVRPLPGEPANDYQTLKTPPDQRYILIIVPRAK